MWNRALTKVSYTFCRPHLPKVLRTVQFFQHVEVQSEPSLQSWALFVSNFCRSRPATAKTETLLRRPRKPLYQKKTQGFAPESVFKPELTPSRPVALLDDDVSDMMIWLTWWWECCPWHGSFLTKLPLVICQMLFVYRCNIYINSLIIYIIKYIYIYILFNQWPSKIEFGNLFYWIEPLLLSELNSEGVWDNPHLLVSMCMSWP